MIADQKRGSNLKERKNFRERRENWSASKWNDGGDMDKDEIFSMRLTGRARRKRNLQAHTCYGSLESGEFIRLANEEKVSFWELGPFSQQVQLQVLKSCVESEK